MPANIEERVVQMTFDNKQFEQGVSTSLKTIDDLKKALNFDEVEGSLKNIEKAFNNLDLSGMANSIDFIASRFEPLGKIADTVLSGIAGKVVDVGKKITDAFFGFSDMSAGQSKYETRTKAVQTIMNATGKSIEEVEAVLDKLQTYTDETSYDFAAMVDNIGKFTSVGVDLELAEKAMEGIGNEAAKSGASIQQANHAMYNFAQALSTGAVKLQDWKSISNATMATKEFKEMLISTAIEMGVLQSQGENVGSIVTTNQEKLAAGEKALKKAQTATKDRSEKIAAAQQKIASATKETTVNFQNFESTLSEGWLTSDVLITTLNKYSDMSTEFGQEAYYAAQKALTFTDAIQAVKDAISSGWMDTFQYLFGNLEEAMKLWTDVANALYEYVAIFSDWRNSVLKAWHEQGGYNDMIEAASNLWQTFMNIVKGVGDALERAFPILKPENMTNALVEGTKQLKDWSAKLLKTFGLYQEITEEEEETTEEIKKTVDAVDEVSNSVAALSEGVKEAASGFESIITGLKRGARGNEVRKMQKQLLALGFRLDKYGADGIFGPETQAALKELQKALGVEQTGVLDEVTKAALKSDEALAKLQNRASKGLGIGSRGDEVKKLQKELNNYLKDSEKLIVDGILGPKTEAAIKKLQKELGVKQTGVWDDATKAAQKYGKFVLIDLNKVSKKLQLGMQSDDVKELQEQLKKTGWLPEDFIADGIYNDKTEEAVKKLQRSLGIAETGTWDKATVIALHNSQQMIKTYGATGVAAREASLEAQKASERNKKSAEKEEKATEHTTIAMLRLQNIVRGWAAAMKIASKFIGAVGEIVGNILGMFKPLVDVFTRLGSYVGEMFVNLAEDLDENNVYSKFVESVTNAFGPFGKFIKNVADAIDTFLDAYDDFLERTGSKNTFSNFFGFLGDYLKRNPVIKTILNTFETVGNVIGNAIDFISGKISEFFVFLSSEEFQNAKNNVLNWIAEKWKWIKGVFFGDGTDENKGVFGHLVTQWDKLRTAFSEFKEAHPELTIENFWNAIKKFANGVRDFFAPIVETIASKFIELKDAISKFFEDHPEISLSNFFETLVNFAKNVWSMISEFFSPGQKSESGGFFDELKERTKAFQPVIDWLDDVKDKIISFWKAIFGVEDKGDGDIASPLKSMTDALKTTEDKLSIFDRVSNWFIDIKDKIVSAWNELMGIGKEDGVPLGKETGFISVTDKLKDFGKFLIDNWPAITLATIGLSFAYGLINAISVARNLSKGFNNIAQALRDKIGKGDKKDTLGNAALKIAGAILMVAGAIALLSVIPVDKAMIGFIPFIAVLGSMATAIILINKLGGEGNEGAKNALMLAGSIGIIAAALWLLCRTVAGNAFITVALSIGIIELLLYSLGKIAVALANSPNGDVAVKGFLAMCAGVLVLVIAVGKMTKLIKKYEWTAVAGFGIVAAMVAGLGYIAVLLGRSNSQGTASIKGYLAMCAGVYVLVLAVQKMTKLIKDYGWLSVGAFAIIALMVAELGVIAVYLAKNSTGANAKIGGFIGMCAGVYVLVLAFGRVMEILNGEGVTFLKAVGALAIIMLLVGELGVIAVLLSRSHTNGGVAKIATMVALVGAVWVLVEAYGRLVSIIANNNPGVLIAAGVAIGVLVGALAYIATAISSNGTNSLIGGIGSAITFVTLAFAMEKIVNTIGDVLLKIKDVDPELLKWFFIGIDAGVAVMAGVVAVLGKLFAKDPVGLLIGEGGLLALLGVLGRGIDILSRVGETALKRFASAMKYVGWGMESFNTSTKDIDLDRLKKVGEFLKDTLPKMIKSVIGLNTDTAVGKMKEVYNVGTYLKLFYIAVKNVGEDGIIGAGYASALLDKANELGSKLTGGNMTIPGSDALYSLFEFGVGLYAYSYTLSQITSGEGSAISSLVTQTNELLGIVTNVENLKSASDAIQGLAGALDIYFQSLTGKTIDENGKAVENTPIDAQKMAEKVKEITGAFSDEEINQLTEYCDSGDKGPKMRDVANGIANLGLAFSSYADNIGKLVPDKVGIANEVIEKVKEINYDKDTIDAFYQSFGDTKLFSGSFAVAFDIFALGLALSSYATNIGKLNKTQVSSANDVLDEVIKIRNHVKTTNNPINVFEFLKNLVVGASEFNLTEFVADVSKLGDGLEAYVNGISGLTWGKVLLASNVLEKILSVSQRLPAQDWWTTLLLGKEGAALSAFAGNVSDLGGGLRDFSNNISGATINSDNIDKVLGQNGILEKLLSMATEVATIAQSDLVYTDMNEALNQMSKFEYLADAVKNAFDKLNEIQIDGGAQTAIDSFGDNIVGALTGSLNDEDSVDAIYKALAELFNKSLNKIDSDYTPDKSLVSSIAEKISGVVNVSNQIKKNEDEIVDDTADAARNVMVNAISAVNTVASSVAGSENPTWLGSMLTKGASKGMEDGESDVVKTCLKVFGNVWNAAEDYNEVRSPSQKYKWLGLMLDAGLIQGLSDGMSAVTKMAVQVATNAYEAARKAISIGSSSRNTNSLTNAITQSAVNGIQNGGNALVNSVTTMLNGVLDSISGDSGIINKIRDRVKELQESMFYITIDPYDTPLGGNLFEIAFKRVFDELFSFKIESETNEIKDKLIDFADSLVYTTINDYDTPLAASIVDQAASAFGEALSNADTSTIANGMSTMVGDAFSSMDLGGAEGYIAESAMSILNDVGAAAGEYAKIGAKDIITDVVNTTADGIKSADTSVMESQLKDCIYSSVGSVVESAESTTSDTTEIGERVLTNIAKGMGDETKINNLKSVSYRTMSYIKDAFTSTYQSFITIGRQICVGLSKGIVHERNNVVRTAEEVALAAYEAACKTLGIQSPSRKFIWIGEMLGEGLAQGIRQYGNTVGSAAADVAASAVANAETGVMKLSDVIGFGDMEQPVIRPVLDLTDVRAGVSTVASMFESTGFVARNSTSFAQGIAARQNDRQAVEVNASGEDYNTKLLTDTISRLNEKIDSVKDDLANFKLYLDGDTLVGYMSPRLDRSLGNRTIMSRRMN